MPRKANLDMLDGLDPEAIGGNISEVAKASGASAVFALTVLHGAGVASAADIKVEPNGTAVITVEQGDEFNKIADEIHADPDVFAEQNGFSNPPELIHPGDQYTYTIHGYTVKRRDTLTNIANKFGTTVDELLEANPFIHNKDVILAGQQLTIPNAGQELPQTVNYKVQPGDTISEIEARAGMAPGTFKKLNPGVKGDTIYAGRVYQVPEGSDELFTPAPQPDVGASMPPAPATPKTNGEVGPGGAPNVIGTYSVEQFMAAIAGNESGASHEDSGDPNAENEDSGAFGYFQIMPENWPSWCTEAMGKVLPQTPENQIYVARFKMLQYYNAFGHNWSAVAIAWFAGPGRAQRYLDGDMSVLNYTDGITSVRDYVNKMAGNIGKIDPTVALPEFNDIPATVTPGVNDKPAEQPEHKDKPKTDTEKKNELQLKKLHEQAEEQFNQEVKMIEDALEEGYKTGNYAKLNHFVVNSPIFTPPYDLPESAVREGMRYLPPATLLNIHVNGRTDRQLYEFSPETPDKERIASPEIVESFLIAADTLQREIDLYQTTNPALYEKLKNAGLRDGDLAEGGKTNGVFHHASHYGSEGDLSSVMDVRYDGHASADGPVFWFNKVEGGLGGEVTNPNYDADLEERVLERIRKAHVNGKPILRGILYNRNEAGHPSQYVTPYENHNHHIHIMGNPKIKDLTLKAWAVGGTRPELRLDTLNQLKEHTLRLYLEGIVKDKQRR